MTSAVVAASLMSGSTIGMMEETMAGAVMVGVNPGVIDGPPDPVKAVFCPRSTYDGPADTCFHTAG